MLIFVCQVSAHHGRYGLYKAERIPEEDSPARLGRNVPRGPAPIARSLLAQLSAPVQQELVAGLPR